MIIFLADLPKPITGMSNVSKNLLESFESSKDIRVIDTAPNFLSDRFPFPSKIYTLCKSINFLVCIIKLCMQASFNQKKKTLYRPINAGYGQIYDIIFIIIARVFRIKVFMHHHSFFYLNEKKFLTDILIKLSSSRVTHIVLGTKMKDLLIEKYFLSAEIIILSNIFITENTLSHRNQVNNDSIIIGHLANLTADKGVLRFIETIKFLNKLGLKVKGEIAGPVFEPNIKEIILNEVSDNKFLSYHGPLYAEDKENFLKKLDIFLFPSSYKNEAEPLVLYEAAKYGSLLIGSSVGCMKQVISSLDGAIVDLNNSKHEEIGETINLLIKKGLLNSEERRNRITKYNLLKKENSSRLMSLQKRLIKSV